MRPVRSIPNYKKKPVKEKKVIAVDFDEVCHDSKHPIKGRRMGKPIEGTQDALRQLNSKGYEIVIHSVWADEKGKQTIEDFMIYYSLPFNRITNIKPDASWYIDDKGIRFTSWEEVLKQV